MSSYFAVETRTFVEKGGNGIKTVHAFATEKARDEWVSRKRGGRYGETGYRRKRKPLEAGSEVAAVEEASAGAGQNIGGHGVVYHRTYEDRS